MSDPFTNSVKSTCRHARRHFAHRRDHAFRSKLAQSSVGGSLQCVAPGLQSQCAMYRRLSTLLVPVAALFVGGCDSSSTPATLSSCQAIAQATPVNSTIPVGAAITVAVTADGGCPRPTVRNETPTVIQLDTIDALSYRVTGRAIGTGHIRVRSGLDSLVTQLLSITVVAP